MFAGAGLHLHLGVWICFFLLYFTVLCWLVIRPQNFFSCGFQKFQKKIDKKILFLSFQNFFAQNIFSTQIWWLICIYLDVLKFSAPWHIVNHHASEKTRYYWPDDLFEIYLWWEILWETESVLEERALWRYNK